MWNVFQVTNGLYGIQEEQHYSGTWAATVTTQRYDEDRLYVKATIHLTEVRDKDSYDRLLEEIRYFARQRSREIGSSDNRSGTIHYHCSGLLDGECDIVLPAQRSFSNKRFVNAEFAEEF
ncbi:MAG: hypothetical protein K0R67_1881 [Paenibacillus sp.]|nr:hypothetical protein [Paenibacillus sp.]